MKYIVSWERSAVQLDQIEVEAANTLEAEQLAKAERNRKGGRKDRRIVGRFSEFHEDNESSWSLMGADEA